MICVVQARLSSKRLPGKVLKKILKRELLLILVRRLKKVKNISKVIVATSDSKSDKKIINFCKKKNISCFKGSEINVALRFVNLIKKRKIFHFVRISGDSPMIDPNLVKSMINHAMKKKFDIFTNVFPRTFPFGQSVEIIKSDLLLKNIKYFNKEEKEHVTKYFYKNYKKFKILNYKSRTNLSKYKMSIDTLDDFNKLNKISHNFSFSKLLNISLKDLLKYYY